MEGSAPVITLVKKGEIGPRPPLSSESEALERTLSMLCSFLSIKDFISFLASSGFKAYAQHEEGWLVLEIGVYQDHTKTLQLYPQAHEMVVADDAMTGAFDDHVWRGEANASMADALQKWMILVTS